VAGQNGKDTHGQTKDNTKKKTKKKRKKSVKGKWANKFGTGD